MMPQWWQRRADDDDDEAVPPRPQPVPPTLKKGGDGSIVRLNLEATGMRLERIAPDVVIVEIAAEGEEATFVQIRSVGKDSQIRVAITGDRW